MTLWQCSIKTNFIWNQGSRAETGNDVINFRLPHYAQITRVHICTENASDMLHVASCGICTEKSVEFKTMCVKCATSASNSERLKGRLITWVRRNECLDAYDGIRWTGIHECHCDNHAQHGPECHWLELLTAHNRCIGTYLPTAHGNSA